ncbi:hypothetical protein ACHAXM_000618 [Skeletonema potamos]
MRFGLTILLAAIVPAGASLAEQAQMTLRGSKTEKVELVETVSAVKESTGRNRRDKVNAMGDDGTLRRKPGKNSGEEIVEKRIVAAPEETAAVTVGGIGTKHKPGPIKKEDFEDKDTYRAQKKAERDAALAEKERIREAEKALREAEKAEKEAKKAELEAEKAKRESEKLAEKAARHKEEESLKKKHSPADNSTSIEEAEKEARHEEKASLKKKNSPVDNSTSIEEVEDDNSTLSLRTDADGWMPTPSPIEVLTPWPTESHMDLICPEQYDPERNGYKAGDYVTVESSIFECQAGEFEEYCNIAELEDDVKRENKHAKKLWIEAWKYVSPCSAIDIIDIDGALESGVDESWDKVVEVNVTVEAETENTSVDEIEDDEDGAVEAETTSDSAVGVAAETEDTSVVEIPGDEDEAESAVDIDSLLQPQLEQHNWDMGFEFTEDSCVSDVCNHKLSGVCLLKYQVNIPEANEPNTITMELICEGVTWLGIGFSQDGLMAGSEAVIGVLGEEPKKYNLGGRWMGGVTPMDDSQQTLIDASIRVYRGPITVLKFTKIMKEQGEIEIMPGDNTFLYAQGQSYYLGQHAGDSRGSFQLNLPSVEAPTIMVRSFEDTTHTATTTIAPTTTVPATTVGSDLPCTSDWCVEEFGVCALKYLVNYPVDKPNTITVDLTCEGDNWIGLGFSVDGKMVGSEAVIAGAGQEPRKYHLGNKWFGPGGVVEMPEYQQTLIDASVRVKWVESSNGGIPLMQMRFTKIMKEEGEIEIKPGENTFLYAQGQTSAFPSYHFARGSFPLILPSDGTSSGTDTPTTVAPSLEMEVTELSPECTLKHAVNVPAYTTKEVCEDCSITIELTCDSVAWVAVGFSPTGFMPQSEAVIGIPGRNPEKYFLKKRSLDRVFILPEEAQTLSNASVTVDNGETVMRFTKLLREPNEIPITQGLYFLFAHGYDENLGYHGPESKGRFQLNLM